MKARFFAYEKMKEIGHNVPIKFKRSQETKKTVFEIK